jgi:uncharacterized protein
VRTCIGCRRRAPRSTLLRVVAEGSRVVWDRRAIAPGRGAWMHPGCVELARKRRAFGRALRITGTPDVTELV